MLGLGFRSSSASDNSDRVDGGWVKGLRKCGNHFLLWWKEERENRVEGKV